LAAVACNKSSAETTRGGGGTTTKALECEGAAPLARKTTYTLGFVQVYEPTNGYTIANSDDMVAEAKRRGYKLVFQPPTTADAAEQASRIDALIDAKVDAIVLRVAPTMAQKAIAARKACIPVFTESRVLGPAAAPGVDYVSHIGTDPVNQGEQMGDWLIKATKGHANIIELEGTAGSSPAIGRKSGFDGRIATAPAMTIVASQSGNFDRTVGHDVAKQLLAQHPTANVIYAHNDFMALGALAAIREAGKTPGKDVLIVSIDGLKEAVQCVLDGTIAAIVFNDPRMASLTFDTIEKYAAGERIPPKVVIKGPIIEKSNAQSMLAEAF
jgi:ribose transport system substrate-binding protein